MKKYKFTARIEEGRGGGVFILFPHDVEKEFGEKGRVPVQATFDGVSYSGSLVKYGLPQHMLGMLKSIRQAIGKEPGDTVEVVLWRDEQERTVEIPPDLLKELKKKKLLGAFEQLSYTRRKEYCRSVSEAKKEETRSRRLEQVVTAVATQKGQQ